jgi:hypothetical protein
MRVKIVERRIRWNPALDFKHLTLSLINAVTGLVSGYTRRLKRKAEIEL